MKYGKLLLRAARLSKSSWIDKWMDYTRLKKLIADIAVETGGPEARGRNMVANNDNDSTHGNASANVKNPVTPSKSFDSNRSITPMRIKEREVERIFFEELKKNLDAIVHFYDSEERLVLLRTKKLKEELDAAVKLAETIKKSMSDSSNYKDPIPLSHLMDSFKVLYVDLMMLENYAVMNYGGFAKILKKHDKNSPFSTQEKYLRKNVNPCSFVTYSRLKDAIKIVEKSFAVLLNLSGQINGGSQEENLKQKVSNDVFNGDMKVSNSAKIHHEFRKKNNTGNHPRARLSTADREKLERLAAISGVASSPESTAKDGKDSSADDDEEVSEQSTADMESKVYSEQPIKKRKISLRK